MPSKPWVIQCTSTSSLAIEFPAHSQQKDACSGYILTTWHKFSLSGTRASCAFPSLKCRYSTYTAHWNVLFDVRLQSSLSADVSACLIAQLCHPCSCCLVLLWMVIPSPAHYSLHQGRAGTGRNIFRWAGGDCICRVCNALLTLPRCSMSCHAGSFYVLDM